MQDVWYNLKTDPRAVVVLADASGNAVTYTYADVNAGTVSIYYRRSDQSTWTQMTGVVAGTLGGYVANSIVPDSDGLHVIGLPAGARAATAQFVLVRVTGAGIRTVRTMIPLRPIDPQAAVVPADVRKYLGTVPMANAADPSQPVVSVRSLYDPSTPDGIFYIVIDALAGSLGLDDFDGHQFWLYTTGDDSGTGRLLASQAGVDGLGTQLTTDFTNLIAAVGNVPGLVWASAGRTLTSFAFTVNANVTQWASVAVAVSATTQRPIVDVGSVQDSNTAATDLATYAPNLTYLSKLNVTGTLAHTDNAGLFQADVSGLLAVLNKVDTTVEVDPDNAGKYRFTQPALATAPAAGGGNNGPAVTFKETEGVVFR